MRWHSRRTCQAIRGAVVESGVSGLGVNGGFYDVLGPALVFLRELGDGRLEVFDLVHAGEVEDVVDLVGGERGRVRGSHC